MNYCFEQVIDRTGTALLKYSFSMEGRCTGKASRKMLCQVCAVLLCDAIPDTGKMYIYSMNLMI